MRCYVHNNVEATGVCTRCGKFVCNKCNVQVNEKSVCKNCFKGSNSNNNLQGIKKSSFILFLLVFFLPIGFNYLYLGLKKKAIWFLKFSILIYIININLYIAHVHVPILILCIMVFKNSLDIKRKMKLGIEVEDSISDITHFIKLYKGVITSIFACILILNTFYVLFIWPIRLIAFPLIFLLSLYIYVASIYLMIKFIVQPQYIVGNTCSNNKIKKENIINKFNSTDAYTNHLINEGSELLLQLENKSYSLKNTNLNKDVDLIINITNKIFIFANKNPNKSRDLIKFIEYYLPTTLKLLNNYEYIDQQGFNGKNLDVSKRRIEDIIKRLVTAYKNQLDMLFEDKAIDIDAEIKLLSDILIKEGLIED